MKTGKLTNEQLSDLVLSKLPPLSANTLVGADIGADCAWINMGDRLMVTSSDPITAGGMQSGTLTIHVSCNDIAACGVRPSGILIVLIAPNSATDLYGNPLIIALHTFTSCILLPPLTV